MSGFPLSAQTTVSAAMVLPYCVVPPPLLGCQLARGSPITTSTPCLFSAAIACLAGSMAGRLCRVQPTTLPTKRLPYSIEPGMEDSNRSLVPSESSHLAALE